mmetsp:Transcript_177602/g.569562  ORF Transcript_177602/g.569562 Transcript_177602/m.569562 type:complete len:349 (-) Transcript_177602:81-1127(-)|eukprot:CAMPEP_0203863928 /NCGR_PEP_ID=MMETSP0359-20131031/14455_1 /ASSEMBLY_ACC=CAM_ASM_000338 /TAXON_ID=268821 /ORGANISM="Scrippsiella Hangoei, Strain SHTV-5" /LENGTH=348 /DNA_ID=CAMNT_0050781561 /DNA_START=43 /DNA_END=1089 /DNA_ORIENTATION=-
MAWRVGRMCGARRALAAAAGAGSATAAAACGGVPGRRDGQCSLLAASAQQWSTPGSTSAAPVPRPPVGGAVLCESAARGGLSYGTCKLRDGRLLAYHVEGFGVPVIVFHGMGSSRLTWLGTEPLSEICPGVQLVAIDRPGYGGSSPPPLGYSYSDFARDVAELADHLKLPRFCVAGHSSGGPYALAAAALLPGRVVACAAISSDAPYSHPAAPPELREADDFNQPAVLSDSGLYGQEPRAFAEGMRRSALEKGAPAKAHAWKGGVDGWLLDFMLERLPWSFRLESITLGPRLSIWVGSEDVEAIKIGTPFMQSLVSGSQVRVVQGGNHGFKSDQKHLAAILTELSQHW